MIFIIDNEGRRLCRDNGWRDFAFDGTYPSCIKTFKTVGWAKRRAKKTNGAKVVHIPSSRKISMNAVGDIREEVPSRTKGYTKHLTLEIKDFIVE